MATPQNHQKSQRQSLSAAKKGPVRGLRNILAQPQDFIWPILRDEKNKNALHAVLKELLPQKKYPEKTMSWSQLRKLSKEERLQFRKESHQKNTENNNPAMKTVILGVNAITRALEKNNICSILLDSNVDPFFIFKHIVVMGQRKNIPVLLVPFLKTVTLSNIGFASCALGIKVSVDDDPTAHFYRLHEMISNLAADLLQTKIRLRLFENEKSEKLPQKSDDEISSEELKNKTKNLQKPIEKMPLSESVYRYRSSRKERAFVPPNLPTNKATIEKSSDIQEVKSWSEFIPLGDDNDMPIMSQTFQRYTDIHKIVEDKVDSNNSTVMDVENSVDQTKTKNYSNEHKIKPSYLPLKVKRIQGNPLRSKATKMPKSQRKLAKKK